MLQNKLNIQYEDDSILVVLKPTGLATQTKQLRSQDLETLIKRYLYQQNPTQEPYLATIHRLDQPVSGLLVFAKSPHAAKILSKQVQLHQFKKCYIALLSGSPTVESSEITLVNYLKKNAQTNTSSVCDTPQSGAKKAILSYHLLEVSRDRISTLFPDFDSLDSSCYTPVHIQLQTGRHHQIRTQFSYIGCPILGDQKYGDTSTTPDRNAIALCAYNLQFQHPITGKYMHFQL